MTSASVTCQTHGTPTRQIGGKVICPACMEIKAEPVLRGIKECARRFGWDRLSANRRASGVPALFAEASFDNFIPADTRAERLKEVISGYADRFGLADTPHVSGFIFIGAPGTGKTHIACAVINRLIGRGLTARYASLPSLNFECRRAMRENDTSIASIIEGHASCAFLVLDEIDLHGASDHDYQVLYEIINSRYERGLPTLAISNRQFPDLVRDLNERIISRILSGGRPINFDWKSHRDRKDKP